MAKIIVNNPKQVINGGAKKYYFKVKGLGGLKGDKGEKGDKGDTGAQGLQGIQGLSATVRIGTTTTGEPGTQASVRNSGTESNAVLDFTIPRGDVGSQPELAQTTGTSTTEAMSQNATTEALNNISGTKQDKLTAGDNVKIENGVISAKDTTYTAGNGLNLNGTEFSADTTVLATKEDLKGYYTKPETDNLLAPKLESEVLTELPTTGEKGKLYLTPKSHTTQTATGNPITATVAEEAGKVESFQLDGDTLQNGTPTPEEPVPIQTVTGLQTISINGTEYPLDLGDIELCGLGDDGNGNPLYKDYIYPDGEDWKIHKATAKSIFKDIEWHTSRIGNTNQDRQESKSIKTEVLIPTSNVKFIGACSRYTVVTAGDTYGYPQKTGVAIQFSGYSTSGNICVYDPLYDAPNQADNFKAARANTEIYYALATPTDTVIADQTLIEQLEAIRTASLQNGANTITNTAIGSNLAGDMEVGYYGYNPRNRYDKWLWLEINNEYEQIGS